MEAAVARAGELGREALGALARFGPEGEPLRELVRMVQARRS
jgi:hypothetical protein